MKQLILSALLLLLTTLPTSLSAQELNAQITVNSDKIQGTNKQVFTSLQNSLMEFVNTRKWTDANFAVSEKIECSMTIIINEQEDTNFKAEIQVQARRPVYNSGYVTTLLNFRDRQFDFEYIEFQPLEVMENTLTSNLTATVMFYVYLILGLDFDSFSPQGGNPFIQQAMDIVNLAQAQMGWNGWRAFESTQNRHAVATALTDNSSELFRTLWYTYHRRGLDEMAANVDRGRTNILEAIPALEELKKQKPSSVLLQIFSDAKLDELVAIYDKASSQEKQEGLKMLSNLYPTESSRLEPMKK